MYERSCVKVKVERSEEAQLFRCLYFNGTHEKITRQCKSTLTPLFRDTKTLL